MEHEPCTLLRHADVFGQLMRRDTFLMRGCEPDSEEPLLEPDLRRGEDRSDRDGELLAARCALIATVFEGVYLLAVLAVWADRVDRAFVVSPSDVFEVLPAGVVIRKLSNEINQGVVSFGRKHDLG